MSELSIRLRLTLEKVEEMIMALGSPYDGEKEFRGSSLAIRALARLAAAGTKPPPMNLASLVVYGFPVVVDELCPPDMIYFGERKDFERQRRVMVSIDYGRPGGDHTAIVAVCRDCRPGSLTVIAEETIPGGESYDLAEARVRAAAEKHVCTKVTA